MHCIHLSHFFFRVIRFFSIVTLVYSVYIAFPYVMHLYTLVTLCLVLHQKIFVPRSGQLFFHRHTCIQWFHSFSLYNALYTLVTLFFQSDQIFSHRHTCIQCFHSFSLCNAFVYTCHAFFGASSENICPKKRSIIFIAFPRHTYIQCLHSVSLCNAFVYTCHAFFGASSENICPKKR